MAELAPRERLQPSLLDRLTDDDRSSQAEPRERRVLSLRTLRQGVLRDLAWLLNTTSLLTAIDAPRLPHLVNSVLNYGVPDLAGNSISNLDLGRLERAIRQAIWDFEPRLLRPTVKVRALHDANHAASIEHNKLTFEIEADMWAQPYPERLYLQTELDLEHGAVTVTESARRAA